MLPKRSACARGFGKSGISLSLSPRPPARGQRAVRKGLPASRRGIGGSVRLGVEAELRGLAGLAGRSGLVGVACLAGLAWLGSVQM